MRKIGAPGMPLRNLTVEDVAWIYDCLVQYHRKYPITEVFSGKARGVDFLGELWAELFNIPVRPFPADWEKHGKQAGFLRNEEMVKECDRVIAFWDEFSKGTKHTIDLAEKYEKPLTLWRLAYFNPWSTGKNVEL